MPGIHSDHRLLKFSIINYTKHKTGNRFWKFNTSLLYNHEYITNIKNIIKSTANTHDHIEDKSRIWEIIKFEIRNYTIIYLSQKKRNKTVS